MPRNGLHLVATGFTRIGTVLRKGCSLAMTCRKKIGAFSNAMSQDTKPTWKARVVEDYCCLRGVNSLGSSIKRPTKVNVCSSDSIFRLICHASLSTPVPHAVASQVASLWDCGRISTNLDANWQITFGQESGLNKSTASAP